MHITVSTTELRRTLEIATRVSTKHLSLPILQCVLLEVEGTTLRVKATNLEVGVEGSIILSGSVTPGTVAVPSQILLHTLQYISDATVQLQLTEGVLSIGAKNTKTQIKVFPHEDFPHIPKITSGKQVLKSSVLKLGIDTTAFAASQSSIKPELGSICITQKKPHTLTFVATDSFRLVEKTISAQGCTITDAILIPYKNALEIAQVASMSDGDVEFFVDESQCAVVSGGMYITSRLINGTFPDYEQIIPKEYVSHITLLTQDFAHALKKTNVFLNKFMQLTVEIKDRSVMLSSQSSDIGTTEESVAAAVEGVALTLSFNQRYFSEIISHVTDDSMVFHFAGIGRPVVIENAHDRSLRYLVMPMNK